MNNGAIHIRKAEEDDRQEILGLLNTVFSENQRSDTQRGEDFWQWKFNSNVFGRSILTLAETEDKIVGFDHLWPWELKCRGGIIKAYQPCDSVVSTAFRGQGLFKQLRRRGIKEAVENNHKLFFNFPNQNSFAANMSIGAQHLDKITWWVKILKPFEIVKGKLKGGLSKAYDFGGDYELEIDKLNHISNQYDTLDQFVGINRKKGFYEWRYQNRPKRRYGMVVFERRNKMITGIFTVNQSGLSREMVLVDMVGDTSLSGQLFKKTVEVAKDLDVAFLAMMTNPKFMTNQLWKKGFIKKKMKNMVVLPIDLAIETKVLNIKNWDLVAGMHDSI